MIKRSLLLASVLLTACGGEQDNGSFVSDISVPGHPSSANQLMWHDNGIVYLGTCTAGQLPNRDNCRSTKTINYSILLERVRRDFFGDSDSRKFRRDAEVANLKNNHPVIVNLNQIIAALTNDINNLKAQKPAMDTLKTNVTKEISDLSVKIADYDEQIQNVNARLAADPDNADLQRLKTVLETERSDLITRKSDAEVRLAKTLFDLSELEGRINSRQVEKDLKMNERTLRWNELKVTSDLLVKLDQELLAIDVEQQHQQRVLNLLLDNNISHRSELLDLSDRRVIERIRASINNTFEYHHADVITYTENNSRYGIYGLSGPGFQVACRSVGKRYKSHEAALYTSGVTRYNFSCNGTEKNLHECSKSSASSARETYKIVCD